MPAFFALLASSSSAILWVGMGAIGVALFVYTEKRHFGSWEWDMATAVILLAFCGFGPFSLALSLCNLFTYGGKETEYVYVTPLVTETYVRRS
jgi:hypothetical protein